MDKTFSAKQVATILECKSEEVAQIGQIIIPAFPGKGKGYKSSYSFKNIVEFQIYRLLNGFGVPRKRIKDYIIGLSNTKFPWLENNESGGWATLSDQWTWSVGSTPNDAISITMHSHLVSAAISIDLGHIKRTITERIVDLYGNGSNGVYNTTAVFERSNEDGAGGAEARTEEAA